MMTCSPIRALMILPSILLVGCANPWAANFQPNPAYRGRGFPPTESVQVRTIDYERFRRYAERERELSIQSTTAPEDLSADEQLASRKRLLEALQIPDPGDHVMVLGWSEFSTTDKLDPYSKPLRDVRIPGSGDDRRARARHDVLPRLHDRSARPARSAALPELLGHIHHVGSRVSH
jgi:hypothetical protein